MSLISVMFSSGNFRILLRPIPERRITMGHSSALWCSPPLVVPYSPRALDSRG